jgi:iron complex outermembrane receptor protein
MEAQALGGSYNTWTGNFYHGWKPGNFEYSVSGGYSESDGYLWNGEFWIKNVSLHLGYDFPWNGKIYGDGQYVDLKKGFLVRNRLSNEYDSPLYDTPRYRRYPASDGEIMYGGMGASAEPGSWWKKERYQYTVGNEQLFSNGSFDVRGWQNFGNREAYNTRRSLGRVFHKEFYDDRSYGTDGTFRYELPYNTITAGIEAKRLKDDGDKTLSDDFRGVARNENYVNANIWGAYIQDDIKFLEKKLVITPGVRYTSYYGKAGPAGEAEGIKNLSLEGFSPSLKITYQYQKDAIIYLSGARALRMPTLPEHYWHYSPDAGVYTGNLSFKNEDGIMIQGGWKAAFSTGTKIEISPYYYSIKDFIQFDLINFVSYNIDRAKLYGIEIGLNQRLSKEFSIFTNYTYQKSKTKGDTFVANFVAPIDRDFDEIPALPQHKVNAGIQYVGSRKEKIALFGSFVSTQKVIYNNNVISPTNLRVREQDTYTVVDLEASYPFMKYFEVSAYIRNLLDENYQERFGYPAAEINFGLGLRAWF